MGKLRGEDKPNLPPKLFWEYNYDTIDWRCDYTLVIARVLERGTPEEHEEMVRFYGKEFVINAIKNDIKELYDFAIDHACNYFNLNKQDLFCYQRSKIRPNYFMLRSLPDEDLPQ